MKTNVLIGAHGVGKTTLIEEVRKRISIYTSDGFSRPIKASRLKLGDEDGHIIINELTAWRWVQDRSKNCIYTRSIIDSIVYTKVLHPEMGTSDWEKLFTEHRDCYSFFYIPIEFELEVDGVRFENTFLQRRIDMEMREFMMRQKISFTTLSGSVTERTDKFIETYKKLNE